MAVVDAALAVLDRVGSRALTIRSVAELAGAAPMSLYVHFANKQELLDLMAAEVTRRLYADAGHATWEAEFVSLCHQVHGILLEHPHWAALLARPIPATVLPLRERLLTLMVEGGIPLREAFTAVSNAGLVSLGLALVEISLRDPQGNSNFATRFERLKTFSATPTFADQNPMTRAALSTTERFELSDHFSAAIRTFIEGLKAKREREIA